MMHIKIKCEHGSIIYFEEEGKTTINCPECSKYVESQAKKNIKYDVIKTITSAVDINPEKIYTIANKINKLYTDFYEDE